MLCTTSPSRPLISRRRATFIAIFSGSKSASAPISRFQDWLYCGDVPVVHLVPEGSAIGGGPSSDTGPFDHFAFLASDFGGIKARLDQHGIKYRENHIARPPIDQLFFPDNNNVMVELNFPRS